MVPNVLSYIRRETGLIPKARIIFEDGLTSEQGTKVKVAVKANSCVAKEFGDMGSFALMKVIQSSVKLLQLIAKHNARNGIEDNEDKVRPSYRTLTGQTLCLVDIGYNDRMVIPL